MRKWIPVLVAAGLLAFAAGCGGGSSGSASGTTTTEGVATSAVIGKGKQCDAGYKKAKLPWGTKCLVHGELCKSGKKQAAAYKRFGFTCVRGRLD